jgi:hypothetical protein
LENERPTETGGQHGRPRVCERFVENQKQLEEYYRDYRFKARWDILNFYLKGTVFCYIIFDKRLPKVLFVVVFMIT